MILDKMYLVRVLIIIHLGLYIRQFLPVFLVNIIFDLWTFSDDLSGRKFFAFF